MTDIFSFDDSNWRPLPRNHQIGSNERWFNDSTNSGALVCPVQINIHHF